MSSTGTRLQIVQRAVKMAGRGAELHTIAKELLNDLLRNWALEYRYPSLRKVGSSVTLVAGSSTVALPLDYGAGMENLLIGDARLPLEEKTPDEFVEMGGFQSVGASSGRPRFYIIEEADSQIRFSCAADQNYSLIPIYFRVPDAIPITGAGDLEKPWFKDDRTLVQGLVHELYAFLEDPREGAQEAKVDRLMAKYRRGSIPMSGGGARIKLATDKFKRRTF